MTLLVMKVKVQPKYSISFTDWILICFARRNGLRLLSLFGKCRYHKTAECRGVELLVRGLQKQMAPQLWLISPEDFNTIWNAINDDEPFELTLVTDSSAVLAGQVPNTDSRDVIFGHVRHNSTAFAFLSAAWNNNQIGYYCTANGVLICFFS